MVTYLYGQTIDKIELIWVDANVNNEENLSYKEEILKLMSVNFSCFDNVMESIDYLKKLKFAQTYIISSGSLYSEFIKEFKASINELLICPKIIVFCGNKNHLFRGIKIIQIYLSIIHFSIQEEYKTGLMKSKNFY